MDPAGIALGVAGLAGLFNTSIDCFEYVQLGRSFGKDFATSQLKLDCARLRLSRWGEAVGINRTTKLSQIPIKDTGMTKKLLGQICCLFEDAENGSKNFKRRADSNTDLAVYNPDQDLETVMLSLRASMRHMTLSRQKHTDLPQKVKWALYQKKKLTGLIDDVTELVDTLENLFPATQAASNPFSELSNKELEEMGTKENLPILKEVTAGQDTYLEAAVKEAMERKGGTLPSVVFSGNNNSGFQLGNNTGTVSGFNFGGATN